MNTDSTYAMEEPEGLDLADYLAILRRRRWYLILPAIVIFAVAAAVALLLPPTYQSEATILIEQQQIVGIGLHPLQGLGAGRTYFVVAVHRVYRSSWFGAALKSVVVLFGYMIVVSVAIENTSSFQIIAD